MIARYSCPALCRALLLLAGLALSAAVHAAIPTLPEPFFELIQRDLKVAAPPSDIDVAVFMTPELCVIQSKKGWFGKVIPSSNENLFRSWACRSYAQEALEASPQLRFTAIFDTLPALSPAETVRGIAGQLSERRYVALVKWNLTVNSIPEAGCWTCLFRLRVPMEIVLFDRQEGKTVWHALSNRKVMYSGTKFDPKEARGLGVDLLAVELREASAIASQLAGAPWAAAVPLLAPAEGAAAPGLNAQANFVLINNDTGLTRSEGYFSSSYPHTVTMRSLQADAPAISFPLTYHNYVALQVPPGRYVLQFGEDKQEVEIAEGGKQVYMQVARQLFHRDTKIAAVSADELQRMLDDAVNFLKPEAGPGSYVKKNRPLTWPTGY